ncbi:MAG: TolC family protein [Myxococcota bacterium]
MLLLSLWSPEVWAISLEEAWSAADRESVPLQLLHEQTRAVEALRTQAWAYVGPKIVLNASYNINEYEIVSTFDFPIPEEFEDFVEDVEPVEFVIQKKAYAAANASVIQPLFSGAALPAMKAVKKTVEARRATEAASRAEVRAGVATAYYGLAVAREAVAVAEQALANAQVHEKLVKAALAAGMAAPNAALEAEIGVARAERALYSAREGVVTAGEALAALTGLAPDVAVALPEAPALPYADLDAALRAGSPRIAAADSTASAARAQALATHLTWLPEVNGRFTYSYTGNTGTFNEDPTMWMIVFEGTWLLWDSGLRVGQEQEASANARLADLATEQARLDVRQKVTTLWERHARAEKALAAVERELALATESLRIAEVAYQAGSIRPIELEDARLGLQAAKLSHLQQRMDRDLAAIELLAATGKL